MKLVAVILLCLAAGTAVSGGEPRPSISELGEEFAKRANRLSVDLLLLDGWSRVGTGDRVSELDPKIRAKIADCRKLLSAIEDRLAPPPPPPPPVDRRISAARAYAEGTVGLGDWAEVVRIMTSEGSGPEHVKAAADAIVTRFGRQLAHVESTRKCRREVGASLLPLLAHQEQLQRTQAARVFLALWPGTAGKIAYDPDAPYRDRFKKTREWKKFLAD